MIYSSFFWLVLAHLILFLISGCTSNQEPEKIEFGKDTCHHCKMLLMDRRFGAELVTKTGKIFKFDTLECMRDFFKGSKNQLPMPIKFFVLSSNFEKDSTDFPQLLDVEKAQYVIDESIRSPMGVGIFAAENKSKMAIQLHKSESAIKLQAWSDVKAQLKWQE